MPEDAYTSTPGTGPSDDDLNSEDEFKGPNDDDKAGKKKMYGTEAKKSKSGTNSTTNQESKDLCRYNYSLEALEGPGFVDPVMQFILSLTTGVGHDDFIVTQLPIGWNWYFSDGNVAPGGRFDDNREPAPSYLSFKATDPAYGVAPVVNVSFQRTSPLAPINVRAFSNSPSYDSDEFIVVAPGGVGIPTLTEWGIIIFMIVMIEIGVVILRKRRIA